MKIGYCFLCHKPVLELSGQYQNLDSYYLSKEDEATREEAFGLCHSSCLASSKWGWWWSRKRLSHFKNVMGFVSIARDDEFEILRNPRSLEFVAIQANGLTYNFSDKDIFYSLTRNECIKVEEEFNVEIDDNDFVDEVCFDLKKNGFVYIERVLAHLGVLDKVIYSDDIGFSDSTFNFDKALWPDCGDGWISARAKYNVYLPSNLGRLLKDCAL